MVGLLLGPLVLGPLAAGGSRAQTKIVVVDDRGQEIVVPQPVERVVVAGTPLFTEILVDIGAKGLLVGVTDSPDNPPEVADLPKVGPSLQPNVERIIALEPDVVFGAIGDVRDQLEAAGLIVVTPVGFIQSVSDIFTVIRVVGLVVDHSVEAELLIGKISEKLVTVEGKVVELERPRAAFLFAPPQSPPYAVGRGSVEGRLLARAGAENVFKDIEGIQQVSFEALIERDPEFIFTDPSQIANLTQNPLLAEVAAVRNGRVIGIKASSLTSTRVAQTLKEMAAALHPEAFEDDE